MEISQPWSGEVGGTMSAISPKKSTKRGTIYDNQLQY
jgi:hypothetical protein